MSGTFFRAGVTIIVILTLEKILYHWKIYVRAPREPLGVRLLFSSLFSAYKLTHNSQFLHSLWRRANVQNVSFVTLFGGQFAWSTQLIIPNYLVILSHRRSTTVFVFILFFLRLTLRGLLGALTSIFFLLSLVYFWLARRTSQKGRDHSLYSKIQSQSVLS